MNTGFKYYPKKLYSKAVKITAGLSSAVKTFGMSRPAEIFYSIKDGVWSDPTIWETVSGRSTGRYPGQNNIGIDTTAKDDVYIHNIVTMDNGLAGTGKSIYNLFINETGYLNRQAVATSLFVQGNVQCRGTIDLTGITNNTFAVYGSNNRIDNFISGVASTFVYGGGNQNILNLSYFNLTLSTLTASVIAYPPIFTKYQTSDLVINGALTLSNGTGANHFMYEIGSWNLTVTGVTSVNSSTFSKVGEGDLLFIGNVTGNAGVFRFAVGNPNIEFRGGWNDTFLNSTIFSGIGQWNFTTNSQTINIVSVVDAPISIVGAITLTNGNPSNAVLGISNVIDCTSASGAFINKATLNFTTAAATTNSLTTGSWDFTTFANTVGFTGNYTATIPTTRFATAWHVTISGTGTKSLGINTVLTGNLTLSTSATLQCDTFNLTVNGTTPMGNSVTLLKSGAGSLIFVGAWTVQAGSVVNLSGNPTVEMRGGGFYNMTAANFTSGTGTWTFSTNNQTIQFQGATFSFNGAVVISGAITVTHLVNVGNSVWQINVSIDGTVAGSTLVNEGNLYFNSTTAPMITGVFTRTSTTNTIGYVMNGNFTVPYTTYQGLRIGGTGVKTLIGTTTVSQILTIITSTITDGLQLSTFDLTVTGVSTIQGLLAKSGAGNVLFVGNAAISGAGKIDFSAGNPTVELRGGIINAGNLCPTGTGLWSFTTNNQTLTPGSGGFVFDSNILISGAITLTLTSTGGSATLIGTVDGNNASSTLDNRIQSGSLQYQHATRPMVTGVLQTNAAANVWKYNKAGDQDVTGGTYRTLELGGSGNKTLQGNVTVPTATYSVTGTAVLVLNGYTLTLV